MSASNGHHRRATVVSTVGLPNPDLLAARLRESYGGDVTLIDPRERYLNGDEWFLPMGGLAGMRGWPRERNQRDGKNPAGAMSEDSWRLMIPVIRDLCDSNPLAVGFLGHLLNFILSTGATWEFVLKGSKTGAVSTGVADGDGDGKADVDPAVRACQEFADEWRPFAGWGEAGSPAADFDLNGDDPTPNGDLQYEAVKRACRDGEAFAQFTKGTADTNGLPSVRLIDPERIRTPPGLRPDGYGEDTVWDWGIGRYAVDVAGPRIGYWKTHPDDPQRGDVIPAGMVAYCRMNVDGCIHRGLSDFFPLRHELERIHRLLGAMAENAAVLSKIAYIVQHAPNTTAAQVTAMIGANADYSQPRNTPNHPGGTVDEFWTQTGTVPHLSNGLQYVPPPVLEGASAFVEVIQACLRAVGQRWGIPEYFSGDSSNSNLASTYMAGGPFERAMKRRQKDLEQFELAVAVRVLRLGVESGRLKAEDVRKVQVRVTFPSPSVRGEMEQVQVATGKLQLGFSKQTLIQELGGDPEVEFANAKAEQKQMPQQPGGPPPGGAPAPGGGPPNPDPGTPSGDSLGDLLGGVDVAMESVAPPEIRLLMEAADSGEFRDSQGRRFCLRNGFRVPCSAGTAKQQADAYQKHRDKGLSHGDALQAAHDELGNEPTPPDNVIRNRPNAAHLKLMQWASSQADRHSEAVASHLGMTPEKAKEVLTKLIRESLSKAIKGGGGEAVFTAPNGKRVRIRIRRKGAPATESTSGLVIDIDPGPLDDLVFRVSEAVPCGCGEPSRIVEAASGSPPGPPPRPGLEWNASTHRWRNPVTGEEQAPTEPGPKRFHHEATHDEIKQRAGVLRGLVNAARREDIESAEFETKVASWQEKTQNYVRNRYGQALGQIEAKLNEDFPEQLQALRDAGGELPGWAQLHRALSDARDRAVSDVEDLADHAKRVAGGEDAAAGDFRDHLADIKDRLDDAHNPVYAALKTVRDHLAGDKASDYKLGRYLEAVQGAASGSPPGPPPRPDLTWNAGTHRWRSQAGKEYGHVETSEKARTAVAVAAEKVRHLAVKAAGLMARLGIEPSDLFDTPDEAGQIGNNPLWGGVSTRVADPMADHLGVSTHTALTLASHALAYAFVKAKAAMRREGIEDGSPEFADLVSRFIAEATRGQ